MAHAVHPNYVAKHDGSHAPSLGGGIVIKSNANQRYASTGATSFVVRELSRRNGLPPPQARRPHHTSCVGRICRDWLARPPQEFTVRNDCACGSTIGPIISANTGMRAVRAIAHSTESPRPHACARSGAATDGPVLT